jgi:hypothetical protein
MKAAFNFADLSSTFKHLANHAATGRKTATILATAPSSPQKYEK